MTIQQNAVAQWVSKGVRSLSFAWWRLKRAERPQIDGWKAVQFAIKIDDHFDRLQFLQDACENDMISIAEDWPEFVAYVRGELPDGLVYSYTDSEDAEAAARLAALKVDPQAPRCVFCDQIDEPELHDSSQCPGARH